MIQIQQWWSRLSDDTDPVMMSSDDPDPVMMSSDDPDPVMMIQIKWWSRSKDEDDLKMNITWRRSWLEDADDEMIQRRRPVMKIVSREYLPI